MVLFEIVGRKRNATITPGNLDWFPRHVWDKFKKGELEEMSCVCGIKELKESASRMCEMALWCVQDSPNDRPPMSAVVKMLEGGVEIMPPRNPFQFLNPSLIGNIKLNLLQTSTSSDYSKSNVGIYSSGYKKATPIMRSMIHRLLVHNLEASLKLKGLSLGFIIFVFSFLFILGHRKFICNCNHKVLRNGEWFSFY